MIRYVCHKVQLDNAKLNENYLTVESFEKVKPSFKLVLFATFGSEDSVIFGEECRKLLDICAKYGFDMFQYNLRISTKHQRWNSKYFNEKLESVKHDVEKVYVVGPVKFMEEIKESIDESELNLSSKLFFV
jgi:hypothetical protein